VVDLDWARRSRGVRRRVAAWEQKMRRVVVIVTRPVGGRLTRGWRRDVRDVSPLRCKVDKIVWCDIFSCDP
jgi:hypothetical protein